MNIAQKQTILTEIETILGFDFDQMIINQLPENTDFNSIMYGKYNVLEFKSLFYKSINQLKSELENGLGLLLPNQENFHNDYGQVILDRDIQNLRSWIQDYNSRNESADVLEKLIYYQIRQGFWDRSGIKLHDVNTDKITAAQQQLELVQKNLTSNQKKFQELKGQYEKQLEEINLFFTTKKDEMTEVSRLLNEATASNTKITELTSLATNKETEINGILKNLNEKADTITQTIAANDTDFSGIKTEAKSLYDNLNTNIVEANSNLTKAKEDLAFIEGKKSQIELLTGMAADGALGSKFNQRQETLNAGLNFWKWAVPVMSVLTGVWIVIVFTCLLPHFTNEWLNIMISILKTSPAFILLGFVFSQYKKERNLQEEYAFKSAVAMTLTAYSEMLSESDDPKNISRQQMLLKSIEMVYNQPQIYPAKSEPLFSFNTKSLKETIETLSEAVKNIKP
jgi:hypothetical protein